MSMNVNKNNQVMVVVIVSILLILQLWTMFTPVMLDLTPLSYGTIKIQVLFLMLPCFLFLVGYILYGAKERSTKKAWNMFANGVHDYTYAEAPYFVIPPADPTCDPVKYDVELMLKWGDTPEARRARAIAVAARCSAWEGRMPGSRFAGFPELFCTRVWLTPAGMFRTLGENGMLCMAEVFEVSKMDAELLVGRRLIKEVVKAIGHRYLPFKMTFIIGAAPNEEMGAVRAWNPTTRKYEWTLASDYKEGDATLRKDYLKANALTVSDHLSSPSMAMHKWVQEVQAKMQDAEKSLLPVQAPPPQPPQPPQQQPRQEGQR